MDPCIWRYLPQRCSHRFQPSLQARMSEDMPITHRTVQETTAVKSSATPAVTSEAARQLASQASAAKTFSAEEFGCDSAKITTACTDGVKNQKMSGIKRRAKKNSVCIGISNKPAFCSTPSDALEPETEAALQMETKQL